MPAQPPSFLIKAEVKDYSVALHQKMVEAEVLQEFSNALTSTFDHSRLLPTLTSAAQRLSHVQGISIGLFVPEDQTIEIWSQTDPSLHEQRLPVEPPFKKEILQVGWPVYIPALSTPPLRAQLLQTLAGLSYESLLVVPLRAAHRVIGVLIAAWQDRRANVPRHEEELLQVLADQTAQALAHIRLYAEQERHLRESEALRRVGQSISATLNFQDVLALVAVEAAHLLSCEAGVVSLCTPNNEVEIASASGPVSQWRGLRVPLDGSLTGIVVQERRAIRQAEVEEKDYPLPLIHQLRESGDIVPRSYLAVPLWQVEEPMGALIVLTPTPRIFSLDDERILQALADQAVHAITNARLYAQLQDALLREREANRQKSAFFASASHELRTPLNIIVGYIDLVREGVIGHIDQKAAQTLDRVRQSAFHMTYLINDLLDLARIEQASFQLHHNTLQIEDFLNEVCTQWEKASAEKGIALRRAIDPGLPTITTDKGRLRQIIDNLLSNALKYTNAGHITVGAHANGQTLNIWVQDTGIGIAPADHDRIFEEFQQVHQKTGRHPGGVGLGLAVTKKLLDLLGGTVRVKSAVGQGSTFTLTLPLS